MFPSYFFLEFFEILDLWFVFFTDLEKFWPLIFQIHFPTPILGAPMHVCSRPLDVPQLTYVLYIFSQPFFHPFYFVMALNSLIFSSTISNLTLITSSILFIWKIVLFISRCLICLFFSCIPISFSWLYFLLLLNTWNIFITAILIPCPVLPCSVYRWFWLMWLLFLFLVGGLFLLLLRAY